MYSEKKTGLRSDYFDIIPLKYYNICLNREAAHDNKVDTGTLSGHNRDMNHSPH